MSVTLPANFKLSDWFVAIGTCAGAIVTGVAVLVSAASISTELFYQQRQQHYAAISSGVAELRERRRENPSLRCVVDRFNRAPRDTCIREIFVNDVEINRGLDYAFIYLHYQNAVYRYNLRFCRPTKSLGIWLREPDCISQTAAIEFVRSDNFNFFAEVMRTSPYLNSWYDVRGGGRQIIFTPEQLEAGSAEFDALVLEAERRWSARTPSNSGQLNVGAAP